MSPVSLAGVASTECSARFHADGHRAPNPGRRGASLFIGPYGGYPAAVGIDIGDDEKLMLAYARGDVRAFEILYAKHRGTLYRFVLRSIKDRARADELFQDTWSRVIVARERYRPDAKFTTWLLQIAHNLVIDHFRRSRPQAGVV